MLQANTAIDVEVYCQQIIVKELVSITVPDFQQSCLQGSVMCFFNRLYELESCGYRAVIHHSDNSKVTAVTHIKPISHNLLAQGN